MGIGIGMGIGRGVGGFFVVQTKMSWHTLLIIRYWRQSLGIQV